MATAIAKFSLMITGTGVGLYAFTEYRSKHIEERIVAFVRSCSLSFQLFNSRLILN